MHHIARVTRLLITTAGSAAGCRKWSPKVSGGTTGPTSAPLDPSFQKQGTFKVCTLGHLPKLRGKMMIL